MKITNEKNEKIEKNKNNKKKSSFFSKFRFNRKKSEKKEKILPNKNVKQISKCITLTPEELKKELNQVVEQNKNSHIVEYYDLPYRYNQTIIKILAQTPHSIFIYWDISDADRKAMEEKYGDKLFYETKPVLLVHNKTLNYSFEVEIDDFTNSWYLRTPTSNCEFNIELGRKKIPNYGNVNINTNDHLIHITSSNTITSPNDHVLKDSLLQPVYFKNVKTNEIEKRNVSNLKSIQNLYNIFEFYGEDEYAKNPSSGFKI